MSTDDTTPEPTGPGTEEPPPLQRPMLLLGEDRPDVEDTTPEQLRREKEAAQAEIERQAAEAHARIEEERARATRELEEREAQLQREIERRAKDLDRAQRKLAARETRLNARRGRSASTPLRVTVPLAERGLLRDRGAQVATALAGIALVLAALLAPSTPSSSDVAEVVALDESRSGWLEASMASWEAMALVMVGQEAPRAADGTLEVVALARAAAARVPAEHESESRYTTRVLERTEEGVAEAFAPGTTPVRALATWNNLQAELGSAVSRSEVSNAREDLLGRPGPAAWSTGLALAALAVLTVLAARARAWPSLAMAGGGTVLALVLLVAVLASPGEGVRDAVDRHDGVSLELSSLHRGVARDLTAGYGIDTSTTTRDVTYWTEEPYWLPYEPEIDTAPYVATRAALGRALEQGEEQTSAAALDVARSGEALVSEQDALVATARQELATALGDARPPRLLTAGSAAGAALLALGALVSARGRRESS